MKYTFVLLLLQAQLAFFAQPTCISAELNESSIQNIGVDDIKKWLKYDENDRGYFNQWKLLSTRSEKLSWWIEVIGFNPIIIRKQRAAWDPSVKSGKYIVERNTTNGDIIHIYMIVSELPNDYSASTLLKIHFVTVN